MRGVLLAALTAIVACDDSVTTSASRPGAGSGPSRVTVLNSAVQGVANSPLVDEKPTVSYPWLAWNQEIATPTESDPNLTTFQVALYNVESGEMRTYASAGGPGSNANNAAVSGNTLVFVSWDAATQRWLLEAVDLTANTRRTVLSLGTAVSALDVDGQRVVWSGTNSQGVAGAHLVDLVSSTGSVLYAAQAGETVTNPRISGDRVLFQLGRNIYLYDANTKSGGLILGGADASDVDGSRIAYAEQLSSGITYYWMFDLATGEQRQIAQMWSNTPIVRAAADRIAFSGTLDPYGDHVFVYDIGTQELLQVDQTLSSQAVWGFDSRLVAWSDDRNAPLGNALDVFYQAIAGSPVNGVPTVDAGGPYAGTEGGSITFTATGTDPDGDVLQYLWTIAGFSFSQPSVTRTFERSGTYDASVQVSDSRGGTATASVQFTVANEPPTIESATVTPQVEVGQQVSLGATIGDPGTQDSPWSYTIAWGDGVSSTGQIGALTTPINGSHAYAAAGNFTVTLTVSDPDGASATATRAVAVSAPAGNTQAGTNVTVSPDETNGGGRPATITFSTVTTGGNTTVTGYPLKGQLPGSIVTPSTGSAYVIATTAHYTGTITVCLTYEFAGPLTNHAPLLMQLGSDGQWRSITTSRSANPARVCGPTTTLTMFVVAADNGRPSADVSEASTLEGSEVLLDARSSIDPEGDPLVYHWSFGDGSPDVTTTTPTAPHVFGRSGRYPTRLVVRDAFGAESDPAQGTVDVANVAPSLGTLQGPTSAVPVGEAVRVSAQYTDPGEEDTHSATIDWGDGATKPGEAADGAASGSHSYGAAGMYTVRMKVADGDGGVSNAASFRYVVVVDDDAGSAKGGGWFESGRSTGRHRGRKMFFEISARYDSRGNVTRGSRFTLRADGLRFEDSEIDWMVVSGSQAYVKGTGRVERSRTKYRFLVTLLDGRGGNRADRVRVRIWNAVTGEVLYDSQPGAADDAAPTTRLGGGGVDINRRR